MSIRSLFVTGSVVLIAMFSGAQVSANVLHSSFASGKDHKFGIVNVVAQISGCNGAVSGYSGQFSVCSQDNRPTCEFIDTIIGADQTVGSGSISLKEGNYSVTAIENPNYPIGALSWTLSPEYFTVTAGVVQQVDALTANLALACAAN